MKEYVVINGKAHSDPAMSVKMKTMNISCKTFIPKEQLSIIHNLSFHLFFAVFVSFILFYFLTFIHYILHLFLYFYTWFDKDKNMSILTKIFSF